jgi:hypothetical protein
MELFQPLSNNYTNLPEQISLYRAVTADISQICDGRDLDKLRSFLTSQVGPVGGGNDDALNLSVHKVYGGEDIVDTTVLSRYQPRAKHDGCAKVGSSRSQDGSRDISSADLSSSSSTHCPRSSRPSPVDRRKEVVSPLKLHKSRRHNSLTTTKTDDGLNISLRKGQPTSRRHSITTLITSPYISEPSKYATNTTDSLGSSSRSSATKMRRRSEPHHRDVEFNLRLSSIMKSQPRYSTGYIMSDGVGDSSANSSRCSSPPTRSVVAPASIHSSSNTTSNFSRLLDISNHRFNLDSLGSGSKSSSILPSSSHEGRSFIPLLQGLDEQSCSMDSVTATTTAGSSTIVSEEETTSAEEGEAWLSKGVEFCSTMEVYVFKPYAPIRSSK